MHHMLDLNLPVFQELPANVRATLAEHAALRPFNDGAVIFEQDEPGNGIYCVMSGAVRVDRVMPEGRLALFGYLAPGTWFGILPLLDKQPTMHRGSAAGYTQTAWIPQRAFSQLLLTDINVCHISMEWVTQQHRSLMALVDESVAIPLQTLLARRLLMLSRLFGEEQANGSVRIKLRISQDDLANMLGATRQRINQILGEWQREGLLLAEYRSITLTDKPGMMRLARGMIRDPWWNEK
jgi:CRP/FNR family transcriptional regulator, cyclic AMP receptor protein